MKTNIYLKIFVFVCVGLLNAGCGGDWLGIEDDTGDVIQDTVADTAGTDILDDSRDAAADSQNIDSSATDTGVDVPVEDLIIVDEVVGVDTNPDFLEERLGWAWNSSPADGEPTQVPIRHLESKAGKLTGTFAEVWNCLKEPGGDQQTIPYGGSYYDVAMCHYVQTVTPGEDGSYLHILPTASPRDPNDSFAEVMTYYSMNRVHDFFQDTVADSLADNIQSVEDRNAALNKHGKGPGKPADRNLADKRAKNRHLEFPAIDLISARVCLFIRNECEDRNADPDHNQNELLLHQIAEIKQGLRHRRKVLAQGPVNILECRDDFDNKDRRHDHSHPDNNRRIDHGRTDLAFKLVGFLHVRRKALKHCRQDAARFTHPDHIDKKIIENLGMLRKSSRQTHPQTDIFTHLDEDPLERRIGSLLFKRDHGLKDRDARINHRRHLPCE